MDELDSLKSLLNSVRQQLAEKNAEKQRYLGIASDVQAVYNRMADDKKVIKGYRDSVKTFAAEKYDTFKGKLYSDTYKARMELLISNYNTVINNLDTNMDRLKNVVAQYENKAYQCNGPIGYFESSINSLVHTIENWLN